MKFPPVSVVCNRVAGFYIGLLPARAWRWWLSRRFLAARRPERQLLVDVSVIIRHDARTGIQRVVRGVLRFILENPPPGFSVRPVFATRRRGYRYAPPSFLGESIGVALPHGGRLRIGRGDVFLGLDNALDVFSLHQVQLMWYRLRGATVHVLAHDLLPLQRPEWFTGHLPEAYRRWFSTVARVANSVICVSDSTRLVLADEMRRRHAVTGRDLSMKRIALGADIENSLPSSGVPDDAAALFESMKDKGAVLMVGTLEPRKGYAQALAAFEKLWQRGRGELLVIVGKPGWGTESLQQRLKSHPENGKRLFWLSGISDEYLLLLYKAARGLLMASEGEGFGLPLVEANRLGVHVLARDIPVFREVMGDAATYFMHDAPDALSFSIVTWLEDEALAFLPMPGPLCGVTWAKTAHDLLACLPLGNQAGTPDAALQSSSGGGVLQPARSVRELLAHDDEAFIRACYLTLLGREAEPEGIHTYLSFLRRGAPKLSIARQLRYSPEGKTHDCKMPRLRAALFRQRLEDVPVLGGMLSLVWPIDGIARKLNRLESKIGRLQTAIERQATLFSAVEVTKPRRRQGRQFLVDVSGIIHHDAGTGIQRVTRSILDALLVAPPEGFEVVPVYTHSGATGYFYAACGLSPETGKWHIQTAFDILEVGEGDVFLGLDYHRETTVRELPYFRFLQSRGIPVYFVVHDLLPIRHPRFFLPGEGAIHTRWVEALSQLDGVVCVSRTVADDMAEWLDAHVKDRSEPFRIGWSHSGADFSNVRPSTGLPNDAEDVLARLRAAPSFLMVGTIEPRKGHAQALAAFEKLWRDGLDVNLVIVGRTGWLVRELVSKLRSHPELRRRLFWLEGVSDVYLDKVYEAATCLLAPSEGEGFGLPLIEAAQHGLPLLVRDMPIFREVAGEYAFYFHGKDAKSLAQAVTDWLARYDMGKHPKSSGMPFKTWRQSAARLLEVTLEGDWYREWAPQRSVNDDTPLINEEKTGT